MKKIFQPKWQPTLQEIADQLAEKQARTSADPVDQAVVVQNRNILQRAGDKWKAGFGTGPVRLYPDMDGFLYLGALIAKQGKPFLPTELYAVKLRHAGLQEVDKESTEFAMADVDADGSVDWGELLDDRARQEYKAAIVELEKELKEARAFQDLARITSLQNDLEQCKSTLAAAVGLGGQSRKVSQESKKCRDKVRNAIERALMKIKLQDEPLYAHLVQSVNYDPLFIYEPKGPTDWQL